MTLIASKTSEDRLKEDLARLRRHTSLVNKHWKVLDQIQYDCEHGQFEEAYERFNELPDSDKIGLKFAWSKGGILRTHVQDIAINGVDKTSGWSWWDGRLPQAPE